MRPVTRGKCAARARGRCASRKFHADGVAWWAQSEVRSQVMRETRRGVMTSRAVASAEPVLPCPRCLIRNIPEPVQDALRNIAAERHVSVEALVRETLSAFVDRSRRGCTDFSKVQRALVCRVNERPAEYALRLRAGGEPGGLTAAERKFLEWYPARFVVSAVRIWGDPAEVGRAPRVRRADGAARSAAGAAGAVRAGGAIPHAGQRAVPLKTAGTGDGDNEERQV
jgi:plasmid stability protein